MVVCRGQSHFNLDWTALSLDKVGLIGVGIRRFNHHPVSAAIEGNGARATRMHSL